MQQNTLTATSILFLFVPVLAKRSITFLGLLLFPFGVAEIIVSLTILSGTYYGSWYAGMLTVILGIISVRNGIKSNLTLLNLRWMIPLVIITIGKSINMHPCVYK